MSKDKDSNNKSNFNTWDIVLTVLFFTSMGLTIWGINIYRLTIIDTKYLLAAVAFGTTLAFIGLTFIKSSYPAFWVFFIKTAIGSGIFYFGLLFLNQQFADKELTRADFNIVKIGTLGRGRSSNCSQPYVIIDFNGTEKQLLFYCDYADIIKRSTKIQLVYSKGTFGFMTIKSKQLVD